MATKAELYNEWNQARVALRDLVGTPAFDAAFEDMESKRKAWEQMDRLEQADKALNDARPTIADVRNPNDAGDVPNVPKAIANQSPRDYIELGPGRIVPFATAKTEGYNRKLPASVQLPSILARYEPGGELWTQAELQREAFSIYARKGEKAREFENAKLLQALNALQEGTDSEGGYLVPIDQRVELIHDPGYPSGAARGASRVLQTARDAGTIPSGTTVTWAAIAEEAEPSVSEPAFAQVSFTIRKSGANQKLSEELLADSAVNLPAFLGRIATESSGRYEDQQSIEGDGSTEPLGFRTTGAAQGNISDQNVTAAGLTLANMTDLFMSVPAQFRGSGMRLFTTSAFWSKVMAISASGGQIWTLPNGADRPGFMFMGAPVIFFDGTGWDDAAALSATEEFGVIGDFQHYVFMDRVGLSVRRDDSVYSPSDQVLFRMRKRYDSFFTLNNAFRIVKGA